MVSSTSPKQNCFFLIKHHSSRMLLIKQSETYLVEFLTSPFSDCEESGILRGGEKKICLCNSFVGKNRTPCGNIWCYWIALFCSLWSNLSQCWAVHSAAELKVSRFVKSKCLLNLEKELYRTADVNLLEVLSSTDSHLVNSLVLVFWTIRR